MKLLNKLFFAQKMSWLKVILFSLAAAVVTAAILLIPIFEGTSFYNIGVTFECWILFAIIIIMNCKTVWDAVLKTFVFFLISQPLIYILQIPFGELSWDMFLYYYRPWAIWTVLCLPGAAIAWLVKKDNLLSALILSVATSFLAILGVGFAEKCTETFPFQLLSVIFCFGQAVVLILVLLKRKRNRIIAGCITLVVTIAVTAFLLFTAPSVASRGTIYDLDGNHEWQIVSQAQDGDIATVSFDEGSGDYVRIVANTYGTQEVLLENELGETVTLLITYDAENDLQVEEK